MNHKPNTMNWKKELADLLLNDNFTANDLFTFISKLLAKQKAKIIEVIKGMMIGSYKDWIKETKKYGGTKEEWEKLQHSRSQDQVLSQLLTTLKDI